jgi:hypothetical protein
MPSVDWNPDSTLQTGYPYDIGLETSSVKKMGQGFRMLVTWKLKRKSGKLEPQSTVEF